MPKAYKIACEDTFEKENTEDKTFQIKTEKLVEESFGRTNRRIT